MAFSLLALPVMTRCEVHERGGPLLSAGWCRGADGRAPGFVLVTDLEFPGRVVQRCLIGGIRMVELRLTDGTIQSAEVVEIAFDHAQGRTFLLRIPTVSVVRPGVTPRISARFADSSDVEEEFHMGGLIPPGFFAGRGGAALGVLSLAQIAAAQAIMHLFVEEDLAGGLSFQQEIRCDACEQGRPQPGAIPYERWLFCSGCATAYELARLSGVVDTAAAFVPAADAGARR
jgi:hypothetical protein